jgi:hypothetical protein
MEVLMTIKLISLLFSFLWCASTSTQPNDFFNSTPTKGHTSYIYAPGLLGSELMMGRYCPQFTAITGEKITWKSGGHVIGQPHTAVLFPEINLKKPGGFTLNPITAIMDGIRQDLFPVIQRFFQERVNFVVEDNPQSSKSVANYSFNFGKANIGQRHDIKTLHKHYRKHIKQYPGTNIVLYGDSRGAATIFNFIAKHKPAQVKAAILEGIFDDVSHCVKHFIYSDKNPAAEERLHNLLSFVMGSYKKTGPSPRQFAETITDDIPLLLITSLKDGLVAPQCTLSLYNRLKKRGHKKVHLLVLQNSLHPCYMIDDADDRTTYETVVHTFYKRYGLPHNSTKAAAGQKAFLATQPGVLDMQKTYGLAPCTTCTVK